MCRLCQFGLALHRQVRAKSSVRLSGATARARLAASRIVGDRRIEPRPQPNGVRGLVHEHARGRWRRRAPRSPAAAMQRRGGGVVDEIDDDVARVRAATDRRGSRLVGHADRRGVDDEVGFRHRGRPRRRHDRPIRASAAARAAFACVRLTTATSAAPARASASTTARAAPRRRSTTARAPRDRNRARIAVRRGSPGRRCSRRRARRRRARRS